LARAMARGPAYDGPLAAGRAQFWKSRLDLASAMIARAKDRGEVATDLDAATALELVIAPPALPSTAHPPTHRRTGHRKSR